MNKNRFGWFFAISDYLSATLAWFLFYIYRKKYLEPALFGDIPLEFTDRFYLGIVLIPLFWVLLYYLIGSYRRVYKRSRIRDLGNTLMVTLAGTLAIFFVLILDDFVKEPKLFRNTFFVLFGTTFLLRYLTRFAILSYIKKRIVNRHIGYNTLMIGDNEQALSLYQELEHENYSQGYVFRGFIKIKGHESVLTKYLPELGTTEDIGRVIKEKNIEDVIIILAKEQKAEIEKVLEQLDGLDVQVKMIPDMYDIVLGRVKMKNVFGSVLVDIFPEIMTPLQANLKRIIDIAAAGFSLLLLGPTYLVLIVLVKTSSNGPAFYLQERIGLKGKPFNIIKFRTMKVDAEDGTPKLSRTNDPRITPIGRVLRKYRLDELPQFYNVLIGEMSLVGPRPERQFFIDKIAQRAPEYKHLAKVKPGITSWGMVKYGYAENIDQMVERMKYDLLYIENMSLSMDLKILAYTVITILGGRGK